ncbi:unnamed protein product [Urochloa humidicola]
MFLWPGAPASGSLAAFLAAVGPSPNAVGAFRPGPLGVAPHAAGAEGATAASQAAASWAAMQPAGGLGVAMPGAAAMAGQGGWPDWWAAAATAALGPDWLRADAGTSSGAVAQSPAANETAARGISAPVRGASARRRGGRAPRPPRAAATPPPPPPPVDVDLTDPRL